MLTQPVGAGKDRDMKTYAFGAGASLHAGYPLAKRMGQSLFTWMEMQEDIGYFSFRETARFLRDHFSFADDIEILFSSIDDRIAQHPVMGRRPTDIVLLCQNHKPALIVGCCPNSALPISTGSASGGAE